MHGCILKSYLSQFYSKFKSSILTSNTHYTLTTSKQRLEYLQRSSLLQHKCGNGLSLGLRELPRSGKRLFARLLAGTGAAPLVSKVAIEVHAAANAPLVAAILTPEAILRVGMLVPVRIGDGQDVEIDGLNGGAVIFAVLYKFVDDVRHRSGGDPLAGVNT